MTKAAQAVAVAGLKRDREILQQRASEATDESARRHALGRIAGIDAELADMGA